MVKTFTIAAGSHIDIDLATNANGQLTLTINVQEKDFDNKTIVEGFGSTLALPYLQKTVELGLMNADFSWNPFVTKQQMALWVEICGEKIGQRIKWASVESFWDVSNLRKARSKSRNELGLVHGGDLIEKCFK